VEGAGHAPQVEHPARVARMVAEFLNGGSVAGDWAGSAISLPG